MREMLEKDKLLDELTLLPEYHKGIRLQSATKRLIALEDCMFQIYIPNQMSIEIYNRMYLASYKAEQKKNSVISTKQYYENFKTARSLKTSHQSGIMGGSDTFTLIGDSGIGKTTAIQRAIELLEDDNDEHINCIQVQCPNDCSVKSLLLSILQAFDNATGSDYFLRAIKSKYTADMLIGVVSLACQNYLNLLVVDEIQNVRLNMKSKCAVNNGEKIIAMLVQLINSTGISVMLVGTPEIEPVFQREVHLARRTVGLRYEALSYNQEFYSLCESIYRYQFTRNVEPFSEETCLWLYQHTGGKVALVLGLIKTAQEISILNGTDCLNISALETAYKERYRNVAVFMKQDAVKELPKPKKAKVNSNTSLSSAMRIKSSATNSDTVTIKEIVDLCKKNNKDIVQELKPYVPIMEVQIQ